MSDETGSSVDSSSGSETAGGGGGGNNVDTSSSLQKVAQQPSSEKVLEAIRTQLSLTVEQIAAVKTVLAETPLEQIIMSKYSVEYKESVCVRYLQARQWDIAKAKAFLAESFNKKKEMKIDLLREMPPQDIARCNIDALKTFYPHSHPGFDCNDRPIIYEGNGRIGIAGLGLIANRSDLLSYHLWTMEKIVDKQFTAAYEKAVEKSRAAGEPEDTIIFPKIKTCTILDLAGLTSEHISKQFIEHIKSLISLDSTCFPEILGKLLVLNLPGVAEMGWNVIKGFLDPKTLEKIEIVPSKETLGRLAQLIPRATLPEEYGGTGAPWVQQKPNTEVMQFPSTFTITKKTPQPVLFKDFEVPVGAMVVIDTYINTQMNIELIVQSISKTDFDGIKAAADAAAVGQKKSIFSFGGKKSDEQEGPSPFETAASFVSHLEEFNIVKESKDGIPVRTVMNFKNEGNGDQFRVFRINWKLIDGKNSDTKQFLYSLSSK